MKFETRKSGNDGNSARLKFNSETAKLLNRKTIL